MKKCSLPELETLEKTFLKNALTVDLYIFKQKQRGKKKHTLITNSFLFDPKVIAKVNLQVL